MFGLPRSKLQEAIRALQDQLAGGPRAEVPPELELIGGLIHTREVRARSKEEPERELLAALPDAAALVGRDGSIRTANVAFEALAPGGRADGLTPVEVTRSNTLGEAVRRGLEGHPRKLQLELPAMRATVQVHVTPLLRGELLLLLRDVTESRRAESMRRDFVANASHELRTPIAAIRGAAETLLDGALEDRESGRRFAEMVVRQADRLERLTKDLLDLSRIESGQWAMELRPVELRELAEEVLGLHADRAGALGTKLGCEVPPGLRVLADARALEQVLVNLVDNAVKYTPPGGHVLVRAEPDGQRVTLAVVDDGPGIERHHLPRLFERFYRVGSREEPGGGGNRPRPRHREAPRAGSGGGGRRGE